MSGRGILWTVVSIVFVFGAAVGVWTGIRWMTLAPCRQVEAICEQGDPRVVSPCLGFRWGFKTMGKDVRSCKWAVRQLEGSLNEQTTNR